MNTTTHPRLKETSAAGRMVAGCGFPRRRLSLSESISGRIYFFPSPVLDLKMRETEGGEEFGRRRGSTASGGFPPGRGQFVPAGVRVVASIMTLESRTLTADEAGHPFEMGSSQGEGRVSCSRDEALKAP